MAFHVDVSGEYGVPDGAIYLYDDRDELVMWDSAEWTEDPSLVYVIAEVIRLGYEKGADAVRHRVAANRPEETARCPACGEAIDYCQGHGVIGDPDGAIILDMHDVGDHSRCHPDGCEGK